MKLIPILSTMVMLTATASAAVVATEAFTITNFDTANDGATAPFSFISSNSGAYGSFDTVVTVTPATSASINSSNGDLNQTNLNYSYSVTVGNVFLNSGFSFGGISFENVDFSAAGANGDSGTLVVGGANPTWTDANDSNNLVANGGEFLPSQFDSSNQRFLIDEINGGPISSFSTSFENGDYRIERLGVSVDVEMIPEPGTTSLVLLAGLGLALKRRR